uniref:Uncharacterized protein n=1 Tax=viral metagenome TaxID=1070528 RepID=A0A6H1ZDF3_9ZZZZ
MKTEQDFYNDTWSDMTKTHRTKAPEFAVDLWGWWRRWQARKLKAVMDRSRAYWTKKREQKKRDQLRWKTEKMWEHLRQHKRLLRELREEAVREANASQN